MTGVNELPSLSLRDINHELNESDTEHKLKESHFGLESQKAMGQFVDLFKQWRMPWDEETQTFYNFDHFQEMRAQVGSALDSEPLIDVQSKDHLTVDEIQALIKDGYQLYFRGKVLSVTEVFDSSHTQGLSKEEVLAKCGYAEWDKLVTHLRLKQPLRKMREVIVEAQRMQFENFMEKFSKEDFYDYLEYKTYLKLESERVHAEKSEWKKQQDALQLTIQDQESRIAELESTITVKTKRQKRLSTLKLNTQKKMSEEANALKIEIQNLESAINVLKNERDGNQKKLVESQKKQHDFSESHKKVKWYEDELKLIELRQQHESNLRDKQVIDESRENEYPEEQQQRIDERYQQLEEENRVILASMQRLARTMEPQSAATELRVAEDENYRRYSLTPTAKQYLVDLKKVHPPLPPQFQAIRESLLTQSTLLNYTCDELHQHFRLRLQPWRQFMLLSKMEFESRVSSRSVWQIILNFFRNIWYGKIPQATEETFRDRYKLVKQRYHQSMHQWVDAALSRFEACGQTQLASMASHHEYADVAVNAYQSFESIGVAIPRLQVHEPGHPRDPKAAYVVTTRQDLTPEMKVTLRSDILTYLSQVETDIHTLERKRDLSIQKNGLYEGMTTEEYQSEIDRLTITRNTIVTRQNDIPSLAKPIDISEQEMEEETWLRDPDILLALNTVQKDLLKEPDAKRPLLDQLSLSGEPEWLASAREKLQRAEAKMSEVSHKNAVHQKVQQMFVILKDDYELTKLKLNVREAQVQELARIVKQPLSANELNVSQERCRRATMSLEKRVIDDEIYFPPELPALLLEQIGDGTLLAPDGRIDSAKMRQILAVINAAVHPDVRLAMMELLRCIVNRNNSFDRLFAALAPLSNVVQTQPPLLERLWAHYFIPQLKETGNPDLAITIRKYSPHLIEDFMKSQNSNTTWALERLHLLLEKPRSLGEALPTHTREKDWELFDDQMLESSIKWANLANSLGLLKEVDKELLQRKFENFVSQHYQGDVTDYHALFSAPFVSKVALRNYWLKRSAWIVKHNPQNLSADQAFLESINPERFALMQEDLIKALRKKSLSKDDGLIRLAAISPGTEVSEALVELYIRAFQSKQFNICSKLIALVRKETADCIHAFHEKFMRDVLLGLHSLSDPERKCIASTRQGQDVLDQTAAAAKVLQAFKDQPVEDLACEPINWVHLFGRMNVACLFDHLELMIRMKMPVETLQWLSGIFSESSLEISKPDLHLEYLRYHTIVQSLARAQAYYHALSQQDVSLKLQTLCDHFAEWRGGQPEQLFELLLANLKEDPVIVSEFFQHVRDECLRNPGADWMDAFFDRIHQPDFSSLDHLEPYGQSARKRLDHEVRTKNSELMRQIEVASHCFSSNSTAAYRAFFKAEQAELLAVKVGKFSDSAIRVRVFHQAALAVLKCTDPVVKSLLRKFCVGISAPYQSLEEYQATLLMYQSYTGHQEEFENALKQGKSSQVMFTDFSSAKITTTDIIQDAYHRMIQDAMSVEFKPVEALNRLLACASFALASHADAVLLEQCGASLLSHLKALILNDTLDAQWFVDTQAPLMHALRSLQALPHVDRCVKVVERAYQQRGLYQRYHLGLLKGQLSTLSFLPSDADELAQSIPQAALTILVKQLGLVTEKIQDKTDPACQMLDVFSERLRGEKVRDADSIHQQFSAQRDEATKHSPCHALIDRLSKNQVVVELSTPNMIRDILIHMPLSVQMNVLRFISYRLQNLTFNNLCLSERAKGQSSFDCANPNWSRRCYQQLGDLLSALTHLDLNTKQLSRYGQDVALEFYVIKLLQMRKLDVIEDHALQSCMRLLGSTVETFQDRIPDALSDPAIWMTLKSARQEQSKVYSEDDILWTQYHHLKSVLIKNHFIPHLLKLLKPALNIETEAKLDLRQQAYRAREILNRIYLLESIQDADAAAALQKLMREFKCQFLLAIQQSYPIPCGAYFATLVLAHYERSHNQSRFAEVIGLQQQVLECFDSREQLTFLGLKKHDGDTLSVNEEAYVKRAQEIKAADAECCKVLIEETLPRCRQSEAITEELQSERPNLDRRSSEAQPLVLL